MKKKKKTENYNNNTITRHERDRMLIMQYILDGKLPEMDVMCMWIELHKIYMSDSEMDTILMKTKTKAKTKDN